MSEPNGHGKYAAPDNETSDARFPLPGSSHLGTEESFAPVRWENGPLDPSLFPPHLPQAGEGDKDSLREFAVNGHARAEIPEHLMLSRLAQSEQMREFFIEMWLQNPALAKQGGSKVQNLLSPLAVANTEELDTPHSDPNFRSPFNGRSV